jgi:hypothetical protein
MHHTECLEPWDLETGFEKTLHGEGWVHPPEFCRLRGPGGEAEGCLVGVPGWEVSETFRAKLSDGCRESTPLPSWLRLLFECVQSVSTHLGFYKVSVRRACLQRLALLTDDFTPDGLCCILFTMYENCYLYFMFIVYFIIIYVLCVCMYVFIL